MENLIFFVFGVCTSFFIIGLIFIVKTYNKIKLCLSEIDQIYDIQEESERNIILMEERIKQDIESIYKQTDTEILNIHNTMDKRFVETINKLTNQHNYKNYSTIC